MSVEVGDPTRTHVAEDAGLRIVLHAHPAINLALVHNGVPLITALEVINTSDAEMTDLTATVHLHGRGTELTPSTSRTYDGRVAAGADVLWDDFRSFLPHVDELRDLNESYQASITVTVQSLWTETAQLTVPIRVLAHNEWFNSPAFYDSLAAFVQPNTHAVTSVLDAAAEILRTNTGDASLGGYQGGRERAALIAAAVYEALRARGIRYIDPPASFENTGQKVRTTSQVLEQRFGTCIDLSVTYAACLEAAGIRPLIWITEGHAFAGFLREETGLPHPSLTDQNALLNLAESGIAVPVDAIFYDSSEAGGFKAAISAGRRFFAEPDRLLGVIGITAARKDGIRPLPSTDEVAPTEPVAPAHLSSSLELPAELRRSNSTDDLVLDPRDTAPARVKKWKRSLLDLSTRNRLLNLRPSTEVIDLHMPAAGLALLDDLVHAGTAITLTPNDELSSIHQLQGARRAAEIDPALLLQYLHDDRNVYATVTRDTYTQRFKKLARTARTMFEETGSANLYLTLGALVHRTPSGKEARAPLFLLPVKIVGGTGKSPFSFVVDTTGVASPNHCLVQWLRIKHNVSISALEIPALDDSGLDIDAALRGIRSALVENKLDFRIDEIATLSICQFGTFGMWKDLADCWDVLEVSPIVRHLTHKAGESFQDPAAKDDTLLEHIRVDEADVPVPIAADGSQLRAVALAAQGYTFVLEGPPGTGKSQTITNLVAHALSERKSVLFVAEKQAALDVVKKRLTKIGLSDFTLDLHGKNQRPNEIRDQLKRAIDNAVRYNEHGWAAKLAEYQSRMTPLIDYPSKIHSRNAAGESLWNAYDSALASEEAPASAPVPNSYVARPQVPQSEIVSALQQFSRSASSLDIGPASPWSLVGPGAVQSQDDVATVLRSLSQALSAVNAGGVVPLLRQLRAPGDIEELLPQAHRQVGFHVPDSNMLQRWADPQFRSLRSGLFKGITELHESCAPVLATFTAMFIESGDIAAFTEQAEEASKGVFGKKKRADQLARDLVPFTHSNVDLSPPTVVGLLRAVPSIREYVQRLQTEMQDLLGAYAPAFWNPLAADAAESLRAAFMYIDETTTYARSHSNAWNLLSTNGFPEAQGIDILTQVAECWRQWMSILGTQPDDFARWTVGRHWLDAWQSDNDIWEKEAADADARRFIVWSRTSACLEPLRQAKLDEYVGALLNGEVAAAHAVGAFIRGAAETSLRERRLAGGLSAFNSALRDGEIADFVRSAAELRAEQIKALPAALLANRPFRAKELRGEVGELRRQLDRKRGGASFRNLMTQYGKHILAATPVMFVSPASLAQFVPPGSVTFDLVVFDEASQVPVSQAIGALGRGRAAVIVGDSQQMPPTSIGQVSINDDDESDESGEVAPEDLESILTECVESGVPQLWLSWHYRSQDESLINFSNQKYYEGRLASLPSPGGDDTAGIEWRRVDGHFNREDRKAGLRTNRVEAEAIVAEVRARLATPHLAAQSLGVVTFNIQQQSLVQDLLEESGDPLVLERLRPDAEEGIFVKNLENVQGDERDVILFSTAFSKKPDDPKMPLNFGPLTRSGGEKRFNVAVTRARRKVLIFTSFDPADIDLARTKSVGLAHLRAYLEMAANGVLPTKSDASRRDPGGDRVQQRICAALRERGYEVEVNFGLSDFVIDFVVREPTSPRWQVAILLDGPNWADRPTVADRDLTPQLLEPMMHWGAALRLWLPEWIDSPTSVLERVDAAVGHANEKQREYEAKLADAAAARAAEIASLQSATDYSSDDAESSEQWKPEAPPSSGSSEVATESPRLIASLTTVEPPPVTTTATERDWDRKGARYMQAPTTALGAREDLDRINSQSVKQTITNAVRETVSIEGPIELDRLARSIGHRFGYDRLRATRKDLIVDCVPRALVHGTPLGTFVWPEQLDREAWRGFRSTSAGMTRPLTEIAPEEIINAMATSCGPRGLDEEALMRATIAKFGQRRLTQGMTERLATCIALGVKSGRLLRIGLTIRAGA
ncbi:DUF4011 domain-containing protein [Gordonia sp. KTR9]|uniref:DUF4011 domain-containing protein n=1 Tax=Gordonia sp. KTR9 TaxID=337191 RepID=UPI00027DE17A|nr:DUF4011 domain-containing protein [Gordonia sp. KTR9]AFR49083.1 Superfamily I DNA and RNA helicase and helicase subunits [Gordonia sp. KTR9]